MSDIMGTQGAETQQEFQGTGTQSDNGSQPPVGQGTEQQQAEQQYDNPFLNGVAEEDRPTVSKYIKQWDASVTRRQMELQQQFAPYRELGDLEDVRSRLSLADMLATDPEGVYQYLHEKFGGQGQQQPGAFQPQQQQFGQPSLENVPEEFAPVVQAFQVQNQQQAQTIQQMQRQMQQMGQYLQQLTGQNQQSQLQQQQAQEDSQLEEYLGLLNQEFGEFDEKIVLSLMAGGMSGEEAARYAAQQKQQTINEANRGTGAKIIGGGAVAPANNPADVTQLSRGQTRDLVKQVLERSKSS